MGFLTWISWSQIWSLGSLGGILLQKSQVKQDFV